MGSTSTRNPTGTRRLATTARSRSGVSERTDGIARRRARGKRGGSGASLKLSKPQIRALSSFSEPGRYRVNWRWGDYGLSWRGYLQLKSAQLIEEQWTWASTTRPDVGITEAGVKALSEHGPGV